MFPKNRDSGWKNSANTADMVAAGTMGLHIVAGTVVGLGIGYALDSWLDTSPWLLLVFLLIGTAAGYKNMIEDAKRLARQKEEEKKGPRVAEPESQAKAE